MLYPGKTDHVIQNAFLYAMTADPHHIKPFHIDTILSTAEPYIKGCFQSKLEKNQKIMYAYDTLQYNDHPNLTIKFCSKVDRKQEHQKEQFPLDLETAKQAGVHMAQYF